MRSPHNICSVKVEKRPTLFLRWPMTVIAMGFALAATGRILHEFESGASSFDPLPVPLTGSRLLQKK
jgi:hypothetical protein